MIMKYSFTCSGHKNILATHKTTFEFTKDKTLTKKGDCIVGVGADFDLGKLKELLKFDKIKITLTIVDNNNRTQPLPKTAATTEPITDTITCTPNPDFNDDREMVIRLGEYKDKRTLGTEADKAAVHINRKLIERIKNNDSKLIINIENENSCNGK